MDRGRKRKSVPAGSPETEGSATKRQKLPDSLNFKETPEAVKQVGLQLVRQLKDAKDKTGRSVSELFLSLPDKSELPDYYDVIKLPIAIDTIEDKLTQGQYRTITEIESDVKRMVANAKFYNDDKSIIYGDAERIRKLLSNFMLRNNPAYKNPDYVAFPTPIPGEDGVNGTIVHPPSRDMSEKPKKPTISLKAARDRTNSVDPNAMQVDGDAGSGDFTGKTFQQAQEQLMEEMIKFTDEEGLEIFQPFVNLPSRSLTDYYKVIKKPTSLTSVRKRTRGQHGREAPTGITDFKTWDALEEEVSYVWTNAREYNEDGSDMYNLANEFEQHFKARLALAKSQVESPSRPSIKLNARPKPVLHLSGTKPSPAHTPSSTPGVSVDSEALARQKQLVNAGANGQPTPRRSSASLAPSRSASQVPATGNERRASRHDTLPPEAVKTEASVHPSPALPAATPATAAAMPPPTGPTRLASSSPHPSALPVATTIPAAAAAVPPPSIPIPVSTYPAPPITFPAAYARPKPISEAPALLPVLTLASHPQLALPRPWRLDVPADPDLSVQCVTVSVPSSVYYLQIAPMPGRELVGSGSGGRGYKLFVSVNGARLMATPGGSAGGSGEAMGFNGGLGLKRQVYESVLQPGVNRVEVEVAAAPASGRGGGEKGEKVEVERVVVFVNLMKA